LLRTLGEGEAAIHPEMPPLHAVYYDYRYNECSDRPWKDALMSRPAWMKKVAIGFLLFLGMFSFHRGVTRLMEEELDIGEQLEVIAAVIIFGGGSMGGAVWLIRQHQQEQQQIERDRLYCLFFELLKTGQGHISILQFAMRAQLSSAAAKAFLDERSREFDATFEVSESGGISYVFPLPMDVQPALSTSQERYNVVITAIPPHRKQAIAQTLHQLLQVPWQDVNQMLQTIPTPVQQGVERAIAELWRSRLEQEGATVLLMSVQ
jgi:ribosomal protein L7/L12